MDDLYGRLGLRRKPQVYNRGVKGACGCAFCVTLFSLLLFSRRA